MVATRIENNNFLIEVPYNRRFVQEIKKLGGKWEENHWTVDVRQQKRAEDLLLETFGENGSNEIIDRVNIRLQGLDWNDSPSSDSYTFCGRTVVRRWARDREVSLGSKVVILNAEFYNSGGTRNNPDVSPITPSDELVFEVYDVPRSIYEKIKDRKGVSLLADNMPKNDLRERLKAEKIRLLQRIAEIDEELQKLDKE